jgi:hypothetical protein
MYGQPARALRRKAQDAAVAKDYTAYYLDGDFMLERVAEYLARELRRAFEGRNRERAAAIRGAQSVVRAARQRALTEDQSCPF